MVTLPAPESLARRKVLMRSSRYSASLVVGRPVMEGGEGGWRGRRGKGERERARKGGEGGRRGREEGGEGGRRGREERKGGRRGREERTAQFR